MRVKLVRENDDPRLLADLERLAGREPEVTDAVVDEGVGDESADPAAPEPFDDPFVRRFVQISVHLKRYAPFYAGAAVWALTMLLIHPLGNGNGGDVAAGGPGFAGQSVPVATASADSAVADLGADAVAAPTFEAVTGASFSDSSVSFDEFSGSSTELAGSSDSSSFDSGSSSSSSDFSSTDTTLTFGDEFGSDEPKQLTIKRSGYASVTGGTPAEQAPANGGLPVAATAGQDSKRSFIEVGGEGSQLRLKVVTDGSIQPETAVIKLCVMTSGDWKADRGQQLQGSPGFDPACSTGSMLDGVWTFDISSFSTEDRAKGFALTPGVGTGLTFQVNFDPFPEPTENA